MASKSLTAMACLLLIALATREATAQGPRLDAATIKAGLHTAAPEENGFVDYVVLLVEEGRLPARLVLSTFQWARKKPRHRFQYFRRALIIRAARIGIRL
jgi:hypothetical protein